MIQGKSFTLFFRPEKSEIKRLDMSAHLAGYKIFNMLKRFGILFDSRSRAQGAGVESTVRGGVRE